MFGDIMMAFVIALLIEWFSLISNAFKQIMISVACISIIVIYFVSGCKLDFIGKIDFGVWIMFIILFNKVIIIGTNKLKKYIKEWFYKENGEYKYRRKIYI